MEFFAKRFCAQLAAFLFLLVLTTANTAFAQRGGTGPRFTIGAMALVGQGKMGNGADVEDRAMIYTPLAVFAGVNFKKFRLGVNYEYYTAGQSVDPAEVGGQNISGKGSAPGVRLEYYNGKHAIGAIYRLSDTYTLDKPTLQGTTASYKSKGGFQIQYYRQIKKRFGFVIDYATETFDDSGSLTEKVKWDRISLGIVFTNFANSK